MLSHIVEPFIACMLYDTEIPEAIKNAATEVWDIQINTQRPRANDQINNTPTPFSNDAEEHIKNAKRLYNSRPKKKISTVLTIVKVIIYIFVGFLLATTLSHCKNSNSIRSWIVWALDVSGYLIMTAGTIFRGRLTNMHEQAVTYMNALVAAVNGVDKEKRKKVQFNTKLVAAVFATQIAWCVGLVFVIVLGDDNVVTSLGISDDALCMQSSNALTVYNWLIGSCGVILVVIVAWQWRLFFGRVNRLWWFHSWSMQAIMAGHQSSSKLNTGAAFCKPSATRLLQPKFRHPPCP